MKWSFPSNNNGDINGISNSGVETFQGTPLKSLAREICQNSLDAAVKGKVVKIEFMPFVLEPDEIPDSDSLENAFVSSLEFWSLQSSKKAQDFFNRAINVLKTGSVPFLRISDFNTTGLTGSDGEYNTPWCNLTKSHGASDKAGTSGGSFGIGKFAPFACSDFRTVFYSTLDTDGNTAFQGISRITSFKREDNEITTGVGYFGEKNNLPVHSQLNLDPSFTRGANQTGTDIYIAAFKYQSTDWKSDIIASILDGFLYAIFMGKLIVCVDDVTISKESLESLIEEYRTSLSENADKYYTVLTSPDTFWYKTNFKNHGIIRLGLIIQSDMHRKVAMVRKTGMKIMDRGNISGIVPFAGVMLIEGDKVNDFLRSIENPQHTKWEPERLVGQVPQAKEYVRELVTYIKDSLEALKQDDATEEIDPSVGDCLPDDGNDDKSKESNEAEALPDTIKSFEASVISKKQGQENAFQQTDGGSTEIEDENGEIIEDDLVSGAGHNNGQNGNGGFGNGDRTGNGEGTNPQEHHKSMVGITAAKVRAVCLDKSKGDYSLTFVPAASASDGKLEIFLSGESLSYDAPVVSAFGIGQPPLNVDGNRITGLTFIENTPVRLKISLNYHDYCSMEVKAYGHKV